MVSPLLSARPDVPQETIPFNRPYVTGREIEYVRQALESRSIGAGGAFTRRCHAFLEQELGTKHALLTTSCSTALEMAALLCAEGRDARDEGFEAIIPSFGFVTTAGAFLLHGYRPVFVDIRPDTLNIDERRIEEAITSKTRVVVALHYAGVPCEMDPILEIAARRGLCVVEDAAQALFSRYRGRPTGSIGDLGCFSFHDTKNFTCGEGGALTINRTDYVARAEILREKGTNRSRFLMGEIDKYTWVDRGSSYLPSELLAAVLLAQVEGRSHVQARRREIYDRYVSGLSPLAEAGDLSLPVVPSHVEGNQHIFYFLVETLEIRTKLLEHMKANGVKATFHYVPLHDTPMGREHCRAAGDIPVTESVASRLIRLPMFVDLSDSQTDYVIDQVRSFFRR